MSTLLPLRVTALVLLGVAVVVGLGVAVVTDAAEPFDTALIGVVRQEPLREPLAFLRIVTEAGATWAVIVLAVAVAVGMAILRQPRTGLAAALTLVLTSVVNAVAKAAVARVRPDAIEPLVIERGYAFPSGHALFGVVAWGIVALLIARSRLPLGVRVTLIGAVAVLIALIGLSRVYLGAHHPTDVLAGWAVGAVIVLVFAQLLRRKPPERRAEAVEDRAAR